MAPSTPPASSSSASSWRWWAVAAGAVVLVGGTAAVLHHQWKKSLAQKKAERKKKKKKRQRDRDVKQAQDALTSTLPTTIAGFLEKTQAAHASSHNRTEPSGTRTGGSSTGSQTQSSARAAHGSDSSNTTSSSSRQSASSTSANAQTQDRKHRYIAVSAEYMKKFGEAHGIDASMTTRDVFEKHVRPSINENSFPFALHTSNDRDAHGIPHFGDPTVYISHAWDAPFSTLIRAVEGVAADAKQHTSTPQYFYIDVFSANPLKRYPPEYYTQELPGLIKAIGHMVLVWSEDPHPYTRLWCLYEQWIAGLSNISAAYGVRFTPEQAEVFHERLMGDFDEAVRTVALTDVSVAKAEDVEEYAQLQQLFHSQREIIPDVVASANSTMRNIIAVHGARLLMKMQHEGIPDPDAYIKLTLKVAEFISSRIGDFKLCNKLFCRAYSLYHRGVEETRRLTARDIKKLEAASAAKEAESKRAATALSENGARSASGPTSTLEADSLLGSGDIVRRITELSASGPDGNQDTENSNNDGEDDDDVEEGLVEEIVLERGDSSCDESTESNGENDPAEENGAEPLKQKEATTAEATSESADSTENASNSDDDAAATVADDDDDDEPLDEYPKKGDPVVVSDELDVILLGRLWRLRGVLLWRFGDYHGSLEAFRLSIKSFENARDDQQRLPLIAVHTYYVMGSYFDMLGKVSDAEVCLADAEAVIAAHEAYKTVAAAKVQMMKADLLSTTSDDKESLAALRKAEEIILDPLTPNVTDLNRANVFRSLGAVLLNQAVVDEGTEYIQKQQELTSAGVARNHPDSGASLFCLGYAALFKAQFEVAAVALSTAVSVMGSVYGETHLETVTCYEALAQLFISVGDFAKALEFAKQSLAIRTEVLGENVFSTLMTMSLVGRTYEGLNQFDDALAKYTRALEISIRMNGEKHDRTADILSNLGRLCLSQSLHEKALMFLTRARDAYTETNPLALGEVYEYMSVAYEGLGRIDEAIAQQEKACAIKERVFGKDSPYTQETMNRVTELKRQYGLE